MSRGNNNQILNRDQIASLQKAGLNKDQIDIVVNNLEKSLKAKIISTRSISIIVQNLVNDKLYRQKFFANPQEFIKEANPQPSP